MRFVKDVELVAQGRRRQAHPVADLADLVDAPVRRRVQLNDVDGAPFANCKAIRALGAGLALDRLRTIDGLGEDARDRRLADASRTAKQIGVGYPLSSHGVLQGPSDWLLPDEIR